MKLIQQTTLHYQEGSSDKIYEVDLCQVGDRYVVNFRYGRRGANLKEGVKTTQPVTLPEARKIFDKLIAEKVNKGYQDVTVPAPSQTNAEKPAVTFTNSATRSETILNRLAEGGSQKWPLERVIWRAGTLKIPEATPLLIPRIGTGNALRDYCIAWALGWCGGEGASEAVSRLYRDASKPEFVRRIAFEALLKLSDESTQIALRSEKIEQLPIELCDFAKNGSSEDFFNALQGYLNSGNYQHFAVLDTIYHIDSESMRPALLEILRTAPLRPNYFQRFRHIFKIAEYRLDAEVFGLLSYRFEKEEAMFSGGKSKSYEGYWDSQQRRYVYRTYEEQLKSPESKFAYGQKTRTYLLRRVWRSLQNLGEAGDPNYVKMAVGLLIPYSDSDAQPVAQGEYYRWNRSNWKRELYQRINWDRYASYLTFNHILYENSPRYILTENSTAWRCREGYKPGNPEPSVREEAFPELWQQQPAEVLRLILASDCTPVNHFAVKVLRTCPQFLAEIDTESVIALLKRPHAIAAQLGFELARDRYNPNSPSFQLILALANCTIAEARSLAYQWIERQRETFLQDSNFIAVLVTSQQSETRQFARRLLSSFILSDPAAKVLIARMIAELLTLPATQIEIVKEIGEILLSSFTPQLRTIGLQIVLDLLNHPMPELQEIGARILLNHETSAVDLPPGWIDSLINSSYESVRGIGLRLFGQLPDEMLLQRYELLVTMATHELADLRNAIRPVLSRIATNHPEFCARLATEMIEVMLTAETSENVRTSAMQLLKENLNGWMLNIPLERVWKLLQAKSTAAQELAGVLLQANYLKWVREIETVEIVKLANYEILAVREAAREMLLQIRDRLHGNEAELLAAARVLESKWKDSREFGERLFSEFFTSEDFTPTVLVSLCDSVRDEVRQFGRNMVIRHFQERDGQDYLLKFSEHPSTDMQLFATNYLENYAAGNAERLQELIPYFISVLSRVNRGGVAKRRIFAFLDAEALKSEAAARIVAEILTRQSATIAIGDKATAIQIMLKIHRVYPQISLPILVKPVANWTA